MMFDIVREVIKWNKDRDNTEYSKKIEYRMLLEEIDEYLGAKTSVDQADGLADITFVAIGSLFKLTGDEKKTADILQIVCNANNQKGKKKDKDGKIIKPMHFKHPEELIELVLFEKNM